MEVIRKKRYRRKSLRRGNAKGLFLCNKDTFKFFKNNSKPKQNITKEFLSTHNKILRAIYTTIAEKMIDSSEGVYINEFGYFGIIEDAMAPQSINWGVDGPETIYYNTHTEGRVYCMAFVPVDTRNVFRSWNFDYSFVSQLGNRLCNRLKAGHKYRFNASAFTSKNRRK